MLPHVTQRLLQTGSAGALEDAAAFILARLRADGASHGEDDDFSGPEREWAALLEWGRVHDRILPLDFPGPEREGGREHDVTLYEPTGRWIKYTKRSASGYTVDWDDRGTPYLLNATPREYLQRLCWQNELFGDDIHLVGLWQELPHQWRLIITQPGLQGERATLDELAEAFVAVGFEILPWRGIGYEGSLPLPIDVIVTRTPD